VHRVVRHLLGVGAAVSALILTAGCGAAQNGADSEGLTDHTPARLASEQKRRLRSCALAAAERSYAEQHTGNVTGSLSAIRGALDPPETSREKFRARRHHWDLDWSADQLEELRVRFGTRGLEIQGRAAAPPDATELHRRLTTSRELPDLHFRSLRGNEVDGFAFHFVERTLGDLERRAGDLEAIYARAREMGVEPVMRDVCPERRKESEPLRRVPDGDWSRVVEDVPGGWRLAGYETSAPTGRSGDSGAIYELSKQKSNWDAVEVHLGDDKFVFRMADLIPDHDFSYRAPRPLPDRLAEIAGGPGVESWATFDTCPRPHCGLDPSQIDLAGAHELKYLTKLIRRVDQQRAALYDVQAASWLARPIEAGVGCTRRLLDSNQPIAELSVDLEGSLRVAVPESADDRPIRRSLRSCSDSVVLEDGGEPSSGEGIRIEANLDNSDGLHPSVLDYEPEWASRDFADGAAQLRYIAEHRETAEIGATIENLRDELREADRRTMTRAEFLETVSESLLAPPFARSTVSPLPPVDFSSGVVYHRVGLEVRASKQAVVQFFALLDDLQEDRLLVVESAEWRSAGDSPTLRTTLGAVSRE